MATIEVRGDEVEVRFTPGERVAALRGGTTFSRGDVVRVEVVDDGLRATRGIRAPGLALPGVRRIGTWRRWGAKELVSVRRDQPAVRIELRDAEVDAVVVGVDDPDAVRAALGG